jgi:hypothetical protein
MSNVKVSVRTYWKDNTVTLRMKGNRSVGVVVHKAIERGDRTWLRGRAVTLALQWFRCSENRIGHLSP